MRLYLDSDKAINNKFTLDKTISGRWKLTSFTFTNNIFNVNDTNNKIYFNENGIDKVATLTNGFNASNQLKTNISTAMNDQAVGTVTVTYDDATGKYSFSNTLNFYFTFSSNTLNSARKLLGMNESDGTNSTSQTSENPIDLNTYKNIFININENDDRCIVGTNYFNSSLIINGVGTFGELVKYIYKDYTEQYVKFKNTKHIEIKIHDNNENDINLNSNYSIIFEQV